jgi:type I restriction enzyme, S subunit
VKNSEDWVPVALPIPDHWAYVDFENALTPISTSNIKVPQKDYLSAGAYPVIDQGRSFIGGYTNAKGQLIHEDRDLIVFGDHTKCFKFVPFPFAPGADGTKILRPHLFLDEKFSYYACLSLRLPDRGYSRHYSFLKRSKFPVAPKAEQQRIVTKIEELFSELDQGVESLKTAREQLKVYRQAVLKYTFEGRLTAGWRESNRDKLETPDKLLVRLKSERDADYQQSVLEWKAAIKEWEAVGGTGPRPKKPSAYKQPKPIAAEELSLLPKIPRSWQYVRLAEIARIGSGMSVSAARKITDPVTVAYLRVANVQRGFLDLSEIKYMDIEKSQLVSLRLNEWDVLFNEGGDRDKLGRGWIWQSELETCITQNHVFRASLYATSETAAKIISHWGNAFGQSYFEKTGKQTTNLASINKGVLSEFPVPLISPAEQAELRNQIDRIMTVVDAQEAEISAALERAGTLRQSVLKKAFTGQLVAQDPNDEPASVMLERIKAEKATPAKGKRTTRRKRTIRGRTPHEYRTDCLKGLELLHHAAR